MANDIGPEGQQGIQGHAGVQGNAGIQGRTGEVGPEGETGETGARGVTGDVGHMGARGPQGIQGPPGQSATSAVLMLPGAFERLTDALHKDARRRRWQGLAFALLLAVGMGGAIIQSASNGRVLAKINAVTGPEAQARSQAIVGGALSDIRRSTDCVALYINGERPPACRDVDERVDRLRAGENPFAQTTTTTRPAP